MTDKEQIKSLTLKVAQLTMRLDKLEAIKASSRLDKLEAFIVTDHPHWCDPLDNIPQILTEDTLIDTVISVVNTKFYISSRIELERNGS